MNRIMKTFFFTVPMALLLGCNTTPDESSGSSGPDDVLVKDEKPGIIAPEPETSEVKKFLKGFDVKRDLITIPSRGGIQTTAHYFIYLNNDLNERFEMDLHSIIGQDGTVESNITAYFPTPDGKIQEQSFNLDIIDENNESVVVIGQVGFPISYRMTFVGSNEARTYIEFDVTQKFGDVTTNYPAFWFKDKDFEISLYQAVTGDYTVEESPDNGNDTSNSDPESTSPVFNQAVLAGKKFFVFDIDKKGFTYQFNKSVSEAILSAGTGNNVQQLTGTPTITSAGNLEVTTSSIGNFEITMLNNYGSCKIVDFLEVGKSESQEQIWFTNKEDYDKSFVSHDLSQAKLFCSEL